MQNKPNENLRGIFDPKSLNPEFPLHVVFYHDQMRFFADAHAHEVFEMGYCLKGEGLYLLNGDVHAFQAGTVVLSPPGHFHRCLSESKEGSCWYYSFCEPVSLLAGFTGSEIIDWNALKLGHFKGLLTREEDGLLSEKVKILMETVYKKEPFHKEQSLAMMLITMLSWQRHLNKSSALIQNSINIEQLTPALRLIQSEGEMPNNNSLANACYMSPTNFRRRFKETFGKAPQYYLLQFRVQRAGVLLKGTGHSILNISLQCGFSTLSSFQRQFRKWMDCSPNEYRKSKRKT